MDAAPSAPSGRGRTLVVSRTSNPPSVSPRRPNAASVRPLTLPRRPDGPSSAPTSPTGAADRQPLRDHHPRMWNRRYSHDTDRAARDDGIVKTVLVRPAETENLPSGEAAGRCRRSASSAAPLAVTLPSNSAVTPSSGADRVSPAASAIEVCDVCVCVCVCVIWFAHALHPKMGRALTISFFVACLQQKAEQLCRRLSGKLTSTHSRRSNGRRRTKSGRQRTHMPPQHTDLNDLDAVLVSDGDGEDEGDGDSGFPSPSLALASSRDGAASAASSQTAASTSPAHSKARQLAQLHQDVKVAQAAQQATARQNQRLAAQLTRVQADLKQALVEGRERAGEVAGLKRADEERILAGEASRWEGAQAELDAAKEQLVASRAEVQALTAQLHTKNAHDRQVSKLDKLTAHLSTADGDTDGLRRRMSTLQAELRRLKKDGSAAGGGGGGFSVPSSSARVAELEQTVREQNVLLRSNGLGAMSKQLQSVQQSLDKTQQQREAAIEELRQVRAQWTRDVAEQRAEWEAKFAALKDKAYKLAEVEVKTHIVSLEQQVADDRAAHESAAATIEQLRQEAADHTRTMQSLHAKVVAGNKALSKRAAAVEAGKKRERELKNAGAKFKQRAVQAEAEQAAATQRAVALEAQVRELKAAQLEASAATATTAAQVAEAKAAAAALQELLDARTQDVANLSSKLRGTAADASAAAAAAHAEANALRAQLQEAEAAAAATAQELQVRGGTMGKAFFKCVFVSSAFRRVYPCCGGDGQVLVASRQAAEEGQSSAKAVAQQVKKDADMRLQQLQQRVQELEEIVAGRDERIAELKKSYQALHRRAEDRAKAATQRTSQLQAQLDEARRDAEAARAAKQKAATNATLASKKSTQAAVDAAVSAALAQARQDCERQVAAAEAAAAAAKKQLKVCGMVVLCYPRLMFVWPLHRTRFSRTTCCAGSKGRRRQVCQAVCGVCGCGGGRVRGGRGGAACRARKGFGCGRHCGAEGSS